MKDKGSDAQSEMVIISFQMEYTTARGDSHGVNLIQTSVTCSRYARRCSDEPGCWAHCHSPGGEKSKRIAKAWQSES